MTKSTGWSCPTPAQIGAIGRALSIDPSAYLPAPAGTGPGISTLAVGAGLVLLFSVGGCSGLFRSIPPEVRAWHLLSNNSAHLELEVDGAITDPGTANQEVTRGRTGDTLRP